ncbi:hypothetical protein D9M68_838280 [compost metagenome]
MVVVGLVDLAAGAAAHLLPLVPFVPAQGGHQAAVGAQALAPHRFAGGLLASGIEAQPWRLRLLPPEGNQAPAGGDEFQFALVVQAQHGHLGGGGGIEALDPAT